MPPDIRRQQRFANFWSIDLSLHHDLPEPLHQHVARVGRRLHPGASLSPSPATP
jgi:hypothetical protein